jgi:hypothetical protein
MRARHGAKRVLIYVAGIALALIVASPWIQVIRALAQSRSAIDAPLFFGRAGDVNDATSGGRYTSSTGHRYMIQITETGERDRFRWAVDNGSQSDPVDITESAQTIVDGVTITFGSMTGHRTGDLWVIYAAPVPSLSSLTFVNVFSGGLARPADQKAGDWISLKDFCVADGVTDCSPGAVRWIQAAKDRTRSPLSNGTSYGARLTCPAGKYVFKSTVVFEGFVGLNVDCDGAGTQFIWEGNATGPVFNLYGVQDSVFAHFSIGIGGGHPLNASGPYGAIQLENGAPGDATSTGNTLRNIVIEGNGRLSNGIVINNDTGFGGTDGNNDFHLFDHVRVNSFLNAGALLLGSQDFSERFESCFFNSYSTTAGTYGVEVLYHWGDTANQRGNFLWTGGSIATSSGGWDFYMDGYSSFPDQINGTNDESYGGFLKVRNDVVGHVLVNGVRWFRQAKSGAPGTNIFDVDGTSLEVTNSDFGNEQPSHLATLRYSGKSGVGAHLTIRNVWFETEAFATSAFFTGDAFPGPSYSLENTTWTGIDENEHDVFMSQTYSAGTVSATHGSRLITGSGSVWNEATNNGFIRISERSAAKTYRFTRISAETGALDSEYTGAGGSGLRYLIGYAGIPTYLPGLIPGVPVATRGNQPPLISASPLPPACGIQNEGEQVRFKDANVPNIAGRVVTGAGSYRIPLAICDGDEWVVH